MSQRLRPREIATGTALLAAFAAAMAWAGKGDAEQMAVGAEMTAEMQAHGECQGKIDQLSRIGDVAQCPSQVGLGGETSAPTMQEVYESGDINAFNAAEQCALEAHAAAIAWLDANCPEWATSGEYYL